VKSFHRTAWKARSLRMNLRKRGFISEEERKEKEICASCAKLTSWTTRRREWFRARTSKKSFHAGRGFAVTSIKGRRTAELLRIEVELHKRVISQTKPSRRWHGQFGGAVRD